MQYLILLYKPILKINKQTIRIKITLEQQQEQQRFIV